MKILIGIFKDGTIVAREAKHYKLGDIREIALFGEEDHRKLNGGTKLVKLFEMDIPISVSLKVKDLELFPEEAIIRPRKVK